jgi:glycosyltransferase involved in cell wall biosynthesis
MYISIIIPTYNRANFIAKTIQSILSQSYFDAVFDAKNKFEILVIDDGSTDDTHQTVQDIMKNNSSIKYIYQKNQGVSSARNLGIKNAQYDWIAFCDSDDLWLENKLQNQMEFLKSNPNIYFCHTNEIWKRGEKTIKQKSYHQKPSGYCFEQNLKDTIIGASTVVLHKKILDDIGLFDEELIVCEDYDMWLRITRKYEIGLIKEAQIIKQAGHQGQLSFETKELVNYRIKALKKQTKYKKYLDIVNQELECKLEKLSKNVI